MANVQQQQQPPTPQQPVPQLPARGPPPAAGAQAAQQPTPPANGKWNGTPPKIFTGDQGKSDKFLQEFWLYRMLNEENETMISPYKQAALALSMIRGPLVNDWVYEQIDHLHNQHHTNNLPMDNAVHWAEFETAFTDAFTDLHKVTKATTEL